MLRWIRLLYFVAHTSCYVGYVFFTSLHRHHATLDTSSALRCTYFMLRWMLLCFLAHISCDVGYVFCTSLHALHVTLGTSSVLRCADVMVRLIRLLFFIAHTSCYVGCVFFTLHILLSCYVILRWIRLLQFVAQTLWYIQHEFVNRSKSQFTKMDKNGMSFPARKPKVACPHWDNRYLLEGM